MTETQWFEHSNESNSAHGPTHKFPWRACPGTVAVPIVTEGAGQTNPTKLDFSQLHRGVGNISLARWFHHKNVKGIQTHKCSVCSPWLNALVSQFNRKQKGPAFSSLQFRKWDWGMATKPGTVSNNNPFHWTRTACEPAPSSYSVFPYLCPKYM